MILSSIWFLRIAQLVSIEGWYCLQLHLDDLRSDEKALNCIRKFDYDSVIPQILYLKFRLHARQVISRVTGDLKEAETVLMMKMDLEQVIQNEFRHIMSNVFKREINFDGSLTYYGDQKKPEIRIVKEIHFITVNREKHSGRRAFLFLNDNHTLYVSIGEYLLKTERKASAYAFEKIIQEIKKRKFYLLYKSSNISL